MPFTRQAVEEFTPKSLVHPLTVGSDGLGCFAAAEGAGCRSASILAAASLRSSRAVTTGRPRWRAPYQHVKFNKYPHRYYAEGSTGSTGASL
jgi:hypothetical protein